MAGCVTAGRASSNDFMTSKFLPQIFTVGHSNHQAEAFFELLALYSVNELVDVRSIPSSGRFPHFKKRSLEQLCASHGVRYRHCPQLGNKGVDGGIAGLLRQAEGRVALAELASAARNTTLSGGVAAFMCAEADWRDCHRQVIAQKLLEEHGIVTTHIMRDGGVEAHPRNHVLPEYYGVTPRFMTRADFCCAAVDEVVMDDVKRISKGGVGADHSRLAALCFDDTSTKTDTVFAGGAGSAATNPTAALEAPKVRRWQRKT